MKAIKITHKTLLSASIFCFLFLMHFGANAQCTDIGMKIFEDPTGTSCSNAVKIFSPSVSGCNNELSVCGDLTNEGTLEVSKDASVKFSGKRFTNKSTASFLGEGTLHIKESTCGTTEEQEIDAGGDCSSTASIPNLKIETSKNVRLVNTGAKVKGKVEFVQGKIILDEDMCINEVTGHCSDKYFVSPESETATKGFLRTEKVGIAAKVMPVGTSKSYAPIQIANKTNTDDVAVRVFDKVLYDGKSGVDVSANSVGKTWAVKGLTAASKIDLKLQYKDTEVGTSFTESKNYVSRYVGTVGNTKGGTTSNSKWDYVGTEKAGADSAGTLRDASCSSPGDESEKERLDIIVEEEEELFTIANDSPDALPVELTSFKGESVNCNNIITWTTASELDNDYFEVQRATDGRNFEVLDIVTGNGTTSIESEYSFTDKKAIGVAYYRLKQVDFDGKFEYSRIIRIVSDCAKKNVIQNIYPNPTSSMLTVEVISNLEGQGGIIIKDVLGRTVSLENVDYEKGYNAIQLNVSNLAPGTYMILLENDSEYSLPTRFVKQ